MQISRRTFLTSAAAGVGLSAGVAHLAAPSDVDLVRATLQRILGDLRIGDPELEKFTIAFKASWKGLDGVKGPLTKLVEFTALRTLENGSALLADRIELYERTLLTDFLLWTDFLETRTSNAQVSFLGTDGTCRNPFADLAIA